MTAQQKTAMAAAVLAVGLVLVPASAASASTNVLTATCTDGNTLTVEISDSNGSFPSGLRVLDSTSVFTVHQITITSHATGETFTIRNSDGVARNQALVDCTRIGNNYDFTWTGFFTPASS